MKSGCSALTGVGSQSFACPLTTSLHHLSRPSFIAMALPVRL